MFQKDMKISLLLDFYGDIFSERRRNIVSMYYNEDLSLSEIADETGISRQGVRDSVKKSVAELEELEGKLGLAKRFDNLKKEAMHLASELKDAAMHEDDETYRHAVLSVAEKLEKLDI